jgi:hypothetical protein
MPLIWSIQKTCHFLIVHAVSPPGVPISRAENSWARPGSEGTPSDLSTVPPGGDRPCPARPSTFGRARQLSGAAVPWLASASLTDTVDGVAAWALSLFGPSWRTRSTGTPVMPWWFSARRRSPALCVAANRRLRQSAPQSLPHAGAAWPAPALARCPPEARGRWTGPFDGEAIISELIERGARHDLSCRHLRPIIVSGLW